ncbi:hypothetical protein [Arthrobacter sp. NPDC056727]|uniref:hypothetical protein n=1 Tax=Arthrobacter sp. NPDC056727 TaxID=3345927 RepID=UPI0036705557
MSVPQAPESGGPPPPHGPAGPEAGGPGPSGPGPSGQDPSGQDPWAHGPGAQGRGCQNPDGYGLAVATLVCGALILPSAFVTVGPAMFAMLFTRPDTGSNGLEWVANVVFYSLPALFTLFSLTFGILALRRSAGGTTARRISVSGFIVAAAETAIIVVPLFAGKFDAFS